MEVRSLLAFQDDNPTLAGTDAPRSSGDLYLWRRLVWGGLALYLAPAFLIVLLVGGLAMVVLALVRVLHRIVRGPTGPGPGPGLGLVSPFRPHIGDISGMVPRTER